MWGNILQEAQEHRPQNHEQKSSQVHVGRVTESEM